MSDLDTVSKNRVCNNPKDFAELSLGPNGVQVLDVLTPEQPTVEARQTDSIIKVEFNGEVALVHSEETMYESSIVRYFAERAMQQGHQAGVREGTIEDILEVLALRFQSDVAQTVKPNLEAIDDLQRLKQLHRTAVLADRLEDFQQVLAENGVETRETGRQ